MKKSFYEIISIYKENFKYTKWYLWPLCLIWNIIWFIPAMILFWLLNNIEYVPSSKITDFDDFNN